MPNEKPVNFAVVRQIGLGLPGAKESRYYGMPALKIGRRLLVVSTGHRSAEPNSISVPVGFKKRDELIARNSDVFYLKAHYRAYPVVLVRLDRIKRSQLRQLLRFAHRIVSSGEVNPAERYARGSRRRAAGRRTGRSALPFYW